MALWDDLLSILSSGKIPGVPNVDITLFGLPSLAFLSIPLVAGLVLGFLVKKALKIAIIGMVVVGAGLYLGVLSMDTLKKAFDLANVYGKQYGPEAMQYAAILFGMLPLGTGFIIGLIIGLKFG